MSQRSNKKTARRKARKARATRKNEARRSRATETCTYRLHLIHIAKTTNSCADAITEGPCGDFETVTEWAIEFGNSLIERCKAVNHDMPVLATIKVYDTYDNLAGSVMFIGKGSQRAVGWPSIDRADTAGRYSGNGAD